MTFSLLPFILNFEGVVFIWGALIIKTRRGIVNNKLNSLNEKNQSFKFQTHKTKSLSN